MTSICFALKPMEESAASGHIVTAAAAHNARITSESVIRTAAMRIRDLRIPFAFIVCHTFVEGQGLQIASV